jgi:ankyrin repeat protein
LLFTATVYKRNFRPKAQELFTRQNTSGRLKPSVPFKHSINDDRGSAISTDRERHTTPNTVDDGSTNDALSIHPESSSANLTVPEVHLTELDQLQLANRSQYVDVAFFKACHENDLGMVELMINQSVDVNQPSPEPFLKSGPRAMHIAASRGNIKLAKILLRVGARIDDTYSGAWTPLLYAAYNDHAEMVSFLLENGAVPGSKTEHGYQPIHFACRNDRQHVIKSLIRVGSSVIDVANDGFQPIHEAVWFGASIDVLKLLLENGADIEAVVQAPSEQAGITPLGLAYFNSQGETIRDLVSLGAKPNFDCLWERSPLIAALRPSTTAHPKILHAGGADMSHVDPLSNSPFIHDFIQYVDGSQRKGVSTLFTFWGLNLQARDSSGRQALHIAARRCPAKGLINFLLDAGADINATDNYDCSAIHLATQNFDLPAIRILLQRGASVNTIDQGGNSALHLTAELSNLPATRLLLKHGATVGVRNNDGMQPLHLAARARTGSRILDILDTLLEKGADVNAIDNTGSSPLHLATIHADTCNVRFLLLRGANVHTKDIRGKQALHHAAQSTEKRDILSLLLENGADVNALDDGGKSALFYAVKTGSIPLVEILLHYGASTISIWENNPHRILDVNGCADCYKIRRLLNARGFLEN